MSNLDFNFKSSITGSNTVNKTNALNNSNPFERTLQTKDLVSPNNLKNTDILTQDNKIENQVFNTNNSKILSKLSNRENLSSELTLRINKPSIQEPSLDVGANTKSIQKKENKVINSVVSKPKAPTQLDLLKTRFDEDTVKTITKFSEQNIAPYSKEYVCSLGNAIITNTSLISDIDCSKGLDKTPLVLATDIFDDEKVKKDPELKTKITNFMSLLGSSDKLALFSLKSLLDRKPPISDETTKNVIDKLTSMLNNDYDSRIGNKKDFVISVLSDVANPSNISQESIGTCAGTSVQIQFAIRNPIEYLKMAESLAKNQSYTTIKGFSVPPNFTFANEGGTNHDTKRTISAKLMQNAIMDYADAETRNFDSSKKDEGITTTQTVKALNEIVGLKLENNYTWNYTPTQLMDFMIKSNPSYDNPVEISLSYEPNGRDAIHSVNVVSATNNTIVIVNPWGREETFPVNELQTRILSVSYADNIDKGITQINTYDTSLKNKISNDNLKSEVLNKITIGTKFEIIQETLAPWNGEKFAVKDSLSDTDKKMILNILDEISQTGGIAQNKVWYPRIKHFCPDINVFLSRLDNNTEQFARVKERLLALN